MKNTIRFKKQKGLAAYVREQSAGDKTPPPSSKDNGLRAYIERKNIKK